jgi:type IV pilus assembly protein PilF
MKRILRTWLVLVALIYLAGCVTTTNQRPVNIESAYKKRIELGMKYLEVGQRDNARYQFNLALKYKGNSAEAYQGFGLVHQANGEMEPAAKAFKKALSLADESNRSAVYVSYGRFLMETGQTKDACRYFEDAAKDYDYAKRSDALYFAGRCALATGNIARVKAAYEHAVNLNSSHELALVDLAEIYFAEGAYPKAKRLIDRLETLQKTTAKSLWLGIRLERIFGNKDKEASYALALKNFHPYSNEYLEYKRLKDAK